MGVVVGCGPDAPGEPAGVVENALVSEHAFAAGDWPGTTDVQFAVRRWSSADRRTEDLCREPDGDTGTPEQWHCGLGPLTGIFAVEDARLLTSGAPTLRAFVAVSGLGEIVPAYVSPIGHLTTAFALYLHEQQGRALDEALLDAQDRFRPFVFDAAELYASPTDPTPRLGTDAVRHGFFLEALTRVAARRYAELPTFHRTRQLTVALASALRQFGAFRDAVVDTDANQITVSREVLRHELAQEILTMGEDFEMPDDEVRRWAEHINGRSDLLFDFRAAPALP